jgi:cbb3-type cytochrome oxidase subunit 3
VNWVGLRNFLIIAAIAGIALVWEKGFTALAVSANQVITVLFVAAIVAFAYGYFRQNRLAWLVLKPWQRVVVIVAGAGVAFLLVAGFSLLGDRLSSLGVIALIAVLVLIIAWVVRESRRFP